MTKREKLIMKIAIEIDGLLTDGVEIHPNSPIHEELNQALRQPAVGGMLRFINALRQTDRYIEMIYMNGACYQFHLLLKTFFPESKPYISKEKDHVITKYAGRYYDITGEVSGNWYTPMTESEIDMASGWSFHRTKVIQIGECPHCEEPIVV